MARFFNRFVYHTRKNLIYKGCARLCHGLLLAFRSQSGSFFNFVKIVSNSCISIKATKLKQNLMTEESR